ncbi:protein NYNRIN-like [Myotis myotis]|uniref:protein NYNRIN-like n=1 Tax=Myotis myotis TaxID=51298 RepID=UPI001748006C|nr:protein NYNRIN-like [Myotis myotis]
MVVPREAATAYLQQLHRLTHLGAKHLSSTSQATGHYVKGLDRLSEEVVKQCKACQLVNIHPSQVGAGQRLRGDRPGSYWEVDFTEVKPARYGYKYLLVFIDTFSGWVEAFPTKRETATVVAKKILEDIFPRFGVPKVIGSDNGPAFVAQAEGSRDCPKGGVDPPGCPLPTRRTTDSPSVPGWGLRLHQTPSSCQPRAEVEGTPPGIADNPDSGQGRWRSCLDPRLPRQASTPFR